MKFGVVDLITSLFGTKTSAIREENSKDEIKPLADFVELKKTFFIEEKLHTLNQLLKSTAIEFTDSPFDEQLFQVIKTRPTSIGQFHESTCGIFKALEVAKQEEEVDLEDYRMIFAMMPTTEITLAKYLGNGIEKGKPFTFLKYWNYLTYTVQKLTEEVSLVISLWDSGDPFLKYLDRRLSTYVIEIEHHITTLIDLGANNDKDLRNTGYNEFT